MPHIDPPHPPHGPKPRVLLFDLGGVLIDFVGVRELQRLLADRMDPQAVAQAWQVSPAVLRFETGALEPEAFAAAFLAEWRPPLQAESFLATFRAWVRGPLPGAHALLDRLRPHYTLACLSNTNTLHWQDMMSVHGLGSAFAQGFASFRLGLAKPDPRIYAQTAAALQVPPTEILFFDDTAANVEGARAVGLQAHRTEGPAAVEAVLAELGLLP